MSRTGVADLSKIQDEQLVDQAMVAAMVGVSDSTVGRWARDGVIPAGIKIGGSRRWRAGAIRAHIRMIEAGAMAVA